MQAHYLKLLGAKGPEFTFDELQKLWIATNELPALSFKEFDETLH